MVAAPLLLAIYPPFLLFVNMHHYWGAAIEENSSEVESKQVHKIAFMMRFP